MRFRNITIPFRVTAEERDVIDKKAARAKLDREPYIRACALGKSISVIEDLKPMVTELKRIGNNLNQLTVLAHAGKISSVNLTETNDELCKIYEAMLALVSESEDS